MYVIRRLPVRRDKDPRGVTPGRRPPLIEIVFLSGILYFVFFSLPKHMRVCLFVWTCVWSRGKRGQSTINIAPNLWYFYTRRRYRTTHALARVLCSIVDLIVSEYVFFSFFRKTGRNR